MVTSVTTALELDQKPLSNQFTLIEENNTSDASFVLSSFIEHAITKRQTIYIILFQNSFGHYHSIGQKLGYNLIEYQKQGNVIVFDFLKLLADGISSDKIFLRDEKFLNNFFSEIREKVTESSKSHDVMLIIDNIGNLLSMDFKLKNVLLFSHCIKTLMHDVKNLNVTCSFHNFLDNKFAVFVNQLRHVSQLNIAVDDLKTGKAVDISGKLSVKWRTEDLMQWDEPREYHYQLLDKNVNVFAPGMKYL